MPMLESLERRRPRRFLNVGSTQHHKVERRPDNPVAYGTPSGLDDEPKDMWQSPRFPGTDDWQSPRFEDRVNRDRQGKFTAQRQLPRARDHSRRAGDTSPHWHGDPAPQSGSRGRDDRWLQRRALDMARAIVARDAEFKESDVKRDDEGKFARQGGAPAAKVEKKKIPHQKDTPGARQAPKGGMIGLNQERYQGGQFLPGSERTEKGAHKLVGVRGTGRVMTEGGRQPDGTWGKWEQRPSPDHYSIYSTVGNYTEPESRDGKLRLIDLDKREIYFDNGERVTPQSKMGSGEDAPTLQDLVDLYNEGERWHGPGALSRKPKAETVAERRGVLQEAAKITERHKAAVPKLVAVGGKEWQTPDGSKHRVYFKGPYRDIWYDVEDGDFHSRNLRREEVTELANELRKKARLTSDAAMWSSPQWTTDDTEITTDWSSDWRPPNWGNDTAIAQDSALRRRAYAIARHVTTPNPAIPRVMAFDRKLVDGALRSQLVRVAMDRRSVRSFTPDGHMRVAMSNISRASVNPYKGLEVPDAEKLGLDPQKTYWLLRHPDELRKAAPSFQGLPVMLDHKPISADDHPHDLVVGALGTDARYEHPFLKNSMTIWDKTAIDAIQSGERKEISCAYHYVPVAQSGVYEGKPFQLIMTQIHGNHCALVESGRVGPSATVADAMPFDLQIDEFFRR